MRGRTGAVNGVAPAILLSFYLNSWPKIASSGQCDSAGTCCWTALPGTREGPRGCVRAALQTHISGLSQDSTQTWGTPTAQLNRAITILRWWECTCHSSLLFPRLRDFCTLPKSSEAQQRHCEMKQPVPQQRQNEQLFLSSPSWEFHISAPPSHSRPAQAPLQRFWKWRLSQLLILWNTQCPKPGSLLSFCRWFCVPPFSACYNSDFLNLKSKIFILLKSRIHEEGSFPWRSTEGK